VKSLYLIFPEEFRIDLLKKFRKFNNRRTLVASVIKTLEFEASTSFHP
jgi:hypothetical protein